MMTFDGPFVLSGQPDTPADARSQPRAANDVVLVQSVPLLAGDLFQDSGTVTTFTSSKESPAAGTRQAIGFGRE
jgi:hypothetical protein